MTAPPAGLDSDYTEVELPLLPGESIILERQVSGQRLKGSVAYIGRKGRRYLLVDSPQVNGSPIFSTAGSECVVRFLYQGVMFGFISVVEHISHNPIPLLYLTYPILVERLNLRKEKRVKVNLTAELKYPAGEETRSIPGRIKDVSCSGCQVIVGQAFEPQDRIDLVINVEDGKQIPVAGSIVRNLAALNDDQFSLGLQFGEDNSQWRDYVTRIEALVGE